MRARLSRRKPFSPHCVLAQADLQQTYRTNTLNARPTRCRRVQKAKESHRNGVVGITMASIANDHICRRQTVQHALDRPAVIYARSASIRMIK